MSKNVVSYVYKDADSGLNYMYHEFGSTPMRLLSVSTGRDGMSKLILARIELLNDHNNPTSNIILAESNGVGSLVFDFNMVVQAPETLRITLGAVTLHDTIWFKLATGVISENL